MGLREKVALVLTAVIFQIACTDCLPRSLKQNPFERYISNPRNRKNIPITTPFENSIKTIQKEIFNSPSVYKTFNFPEVEYPSDSKDSFYFHNANLQSICPIEASSTSYTYDSALLDKLRKEARKKRKNNKYIVEKSKDTSLGEQLTQSEPSLQTIFRTDIGAFPEVEYPLSAIDTWTPKYWNQVSYHNDDPYLKSDDYLYKAKPVKQKDSNLYIKPASMKENKGSFIIVTKPKEENIKEVSTTGAVDQKIAKNELPLKMNAEIRTEGNLIHNITADRPSSEHQTRSKPKQRDKISSSSKQQNGHRNDLRPRLEQRINKTIASVNNTIICPVEVNSENQSTICDIHVPNNTETGDSNIFILPTDTMLDSPALLNIEQYNNLYLNIYKSSHENESMIVGECPNEVVCDIIQVNSTEPILDKVTHEAMIIPTEINMGQGSSVIHIDTDSTKVISNFAFQEFPNVDLSKNTFPVAKEQFILPTNENKYLDEQLAPMFDASGVITADETYLSPEQLNQNTETLFKPYYPLFYDNQRYIHDETDPNFFMFDQSSRENTEFLDEPKHVCYLSNDTANLLPCLSLIEYISENTRSKDIENNILRDLLRSCLPGYKIAMDLLPIDDINFMNKTDNHTLCTPDLSDALPINQILYIPSLLDILTGTMLKNNLINNTLLNNLTGILLDTPTIDTFLDVLTTDSQLDLSSVDSISDVTDKILSDGLVEDLLHNYKIIGSLQDETFNDLLTENLLVLKSGVSDTDTLRNVSDTNSLTPILTYTTLPADVSDTDSLAKLFNTDSSPDVPKIDMLPDIPNIASLSNASPTVTTSQLDILATVLPSDIADTISLLNISTASDLDSVSVADNPATDSLSDVHNTKYISDILDTSSLLDIPTTSLSDIPATASLPDISKTDPLQYIPAYESLSYVPDTNSQSNVLETDPLSNVPVLDSLADVPNTNLQSGSLVVDSNDSVTDIFSTDSLSNEETSDSMTNILATDKLLNVLDIHSLSDFLPIDSPFDVHNTEPVSDAYTTLLLDVPDNTSLSDIPDIETLSPIPASDSLSEFSNTDSLSEVPKTDSMSDIRAFDSSSDIPSTDIQSDIPATDLMSNISVTDALLNISDADSLTDVLATDKLSDVIAKDSLSDIPAIDSILDVRDTGSILDANTTLLSGIPDITSLTDEISDSNTDSLPSILASDSLLDISDNNLLSKVPDAESILSLPEIDRLSEISELDSLSEVSKTYSLSDVRETEPLSVIPASDSLSDNLDVHSQSSLTAADPLSDILITYDTLKKMKNNDTLADDVLLDEPDTDTPPDLPDRMIITDTILQTTDRNDTRL